MDKHGSRVAGAQCQGSSFVFFLHRCSDCFLDNR